ncbi:hypothetical protein B0H14DRAFT_3593873, partial [Mycena olivaceomarginata]
LIYSFPLSTSKLSLAPPLPDASTALQSSRESTVSTQGPSPRYSAPSSAVPSDSRNLPAINEREYTNSTQTRSARLTRIEGDGTAIKLLKDPLLIAQIKALEPFSTEADALVTKFSAVHSKLNTLEGLIDFATRKMADSPISATFKDLRQRLQVAKQQAQAGSTLASHREKRKFVDMVGLNKQYGKSIHDILASQQEDSVGSPHNPRILWCYRHPETSVPVRHRQVLADARSRIAEDAIINAENGYETVGAESVIILACDEAGNHMVDADGEYIIELVALQGVLIQSELALPVYTWLSGVIETASSERRNVCPNHPGVMTQAGYNAGPRHALIFGLAKSYTKVLDSATMVQHDEDVISAVSLTWSVCRSFLPTNLISKIGGYLENARMPTMATRNVEPGLGYRLTFQGKELVFPNFERGPSEFIMSQDYSVSAHRDDCFAEFCLSWTVDHKVDPPEPTQAAAVPAMAGVTTRQQSRQTPHTVSLDPDPVSGGANFVDVTLKVKVEIICMAQPASVVPTLVQPLYVLHLTSKQPLKKHSRVFWWSRTQGQAKVGQVKVYIKTALFEYKVSQSHGAW